MKTLTSFLAIGLVAVSLAPPILRPTKTYKGAWFSVKYPSDFKATTGIKGSDGSDVQSAFFTSPDKAVQFYVFSPQWNGTPSDYAIDAKRERLISHKEETANKSGEQPQKIQARWFTVQAKDGSYTRSWVDTENVTLNTRLVFGIKYRDSRTYAAYKARFEAFKKSLEQFSD